MSSRPSSPSCGLVCLQEVPNEPEEVTGEPLRLENGALRRYRMGNWASQRASRTAMLGPELSDVHFLQMYLTRRRAVSRRKGCNDLGRLEADCHAVDIQPSPASAISGAQSQDDSTTQVLITNLSYVESKNAHIGVTQPI